MANKMLKGIGASEGIGIGSVVLVEQHNLTVKRKKVNDVDAEVRRLENKIEEFEAETMALANKISQVVGEHDADIIRGHVLMLEDPMVKDEAIKTIRAEGINAEAALSQVLDSTAAIFASIQNELIQQRATDLMDVKLRMLTLLMGIEDVNISDVPAGTVLVARDLTPSMTAGINPDNIAGIMTESGGRTSHSAILARAMGIPAVLSIENICTTVSNGQQVIVDGTNGNVIVTPDESEIAEYKKLCEAFEEEKELLKVYKGRPTTTRDGIKVQLVCNIDNSADTEKVVECDGEGVGLFRTEFLFMDRDTVPTEDEQFEEYRSVAEKLKGKPVIIRTLDIGGDKAIPALGVDQEQNPFLGFRAIRFCLQREDIYRSQLKAILRASAYGQIKIMIPLVTGVDEFRKVKAIISELMKELDDAGIVYNKSIEVGVMMETPAACIVADLLAKEADFFSIGTNDLIGYTMAVDRGNAKVAYLYSTYNPAVLRAIRTIIECGRAAGIRVGMCGEAAADPKLIPLLLSFGLDEFSVSATSVLSTRKAISECDLETADEITAQVMQAATEEEVREIIKKIL